MSLAAQFYEFIKYTLSVFIGGMVTYKIQSALKLKEENLSFLNTSLSILRTLRHQRSQLITLQKEFEGRLRLLHEKITQNSEITAGNDLITIVQKIRGEEIIKLDIPALYKFSVNKKFLQKYEDSMDKLFAWSRRYSTSIEAILELNVAKDNMIDINEKDNVKHLAQLQEYLGFLNHHLPELIKNITNEVEKNQTCYKDFQSTLKLIFGDVPELMGQDGEIEKVL